MKRELKDSAGLTENQFLKNYQVTDYERPSVTVDTLVFTVINKPSDDIRKLDEKELKILLIKRKNHPYLGSWAFPGGFVKMEESLEAAANRMIQEETNLTSIYFEQLYTYGQVNRDPRMRVLSVAYMALIPNEHLKPQIGRDASEVQWFSLKKEKGKEAGHWFLKLVSEDEKVTLIYEVTERQVRRGVAIETEVFINPKALSEAQLAFDHYQILVTAMHRLKNKVEFTPIAFNLVGELFTRAEIQAIYELLLDEKLTRIELWRKIKDMVIETELTTKEKGHRPSKYYRFNKEWRYKY